MKLYLDTETVGLQGPVKTIQFAIDDGPVQILSLYRGEPIPAEGLDLLNRVLYDPATTFIGFSVQFDLFHLYRLFHILEGNDERSRESSVPPFRCQTLDLQVHAMQDSPLAPFAFSRSRSRTIARIRKIPKVAMDRVADRVTRELRPLVPSFFGLHLGVHKVDARPDLCTLSWTVEGSLTLKGLMKSYDIPTIPLEEVWPLPERKDEKPWLPYSDPSVHDPVETACEAVMRDPKSRFWDYAKLDILYLKVLEQRLGNPKPDHHSECAHAVAYTRYVGFPLDRSALNASMEHYSQQIDALKTRLSGLDLNSAPQKLKALQALDPLIAATNKKVLKVIADSDSPAASLASDIQEHGPAQQRLVQLQKVAECATGRAHPDFRIMGTKTGRMAGTAGLNWQGIAQAELIEQEDMDDDEQELDDGIADLENQEQEKLAVGLRASLLSPAGGDWAQFEIVLGAHIYGDKRIAADIEHGVDGHCVIASLFHPKARSRKLSYEDLVAGYKAGDPDCVKMRKQSKAGTFSMQYWAAAPKLADIFGLSLREAEEALSRYYSHYAGFAAYRKRIESETLTADTEHWDRDSVSKMARTVTDITGYKMDWTYEATVADVLWRLGGTGIFTGCQGKVTRQKEKGEQTIDGAVRSSLLGAALAIQQAVARQRGNAKIQASGANINKMLMARIWRTCRVPMANIHDEIIFGAHPNFYYPKVLAEVQAFVLEWSSKVKHLRMDIKETRVWADK